MSQPSTDALDPEIEQQTRLVRGLMAGLYARIDSDPDESLLRELAEAKQTLRELQQRRDVTRAEAEKAQAGPKRTMGVPLGPETTGLRVVTTIRLQPIPTGVYHLLDPQTDPLLTVAVKNESHETKRICVTAYIEGCGPCHQDRRAGSHGPRGAEQIHLLPSLIPEHARRIADGPVLHPARRGRRPGQEGRIAPTPQPGAPGTRTPPASTRSLTRDRPPPRPDEVLRRLGYTPRRAGPGPSAQGRREGARPPDLGIPGPA